MSDYVEKFREELLEYFKRGGKEVTILPAERYAGSYSRLFILAPNGLSYGRVNFHNDQYTHHKTYTSTSRDMAKIIKVGVAATELALSRQTEGKEEASMNTGIEVEEIQLTSPCTRDDHIDASSFDPLNLIAEFLTYPHQKETPMPYIINSLKNTPFTKVPVVFGEIVHDETPDQLMQRIEQLEKRKKHLSRLETKTKYADNEIKHIDGAIKELTSILDSQIPTE